MDANVYDRQNLNNSSDDETNSSYSIDDNDSISDSDSDLNGNNTMPLKLTCGSFYLPKSNKAKPQGDDAHFICDEKNAIGVADGFGSCSKKGIDGGQYARDLMVNSVISLYQRTKGSVNPGQILLSAYRKTRTLGSSTALIIALNKNNLLRYANLGDSKMAVFRNKELIYESLIQQHEFNHPYQLGRESDDTPDMAYKGEICVKDGDIIVAGTDGVWDNVYPSEIEEILKWKIGDFDVEKMAAKIAKRAERHSLSRMFYSPYAKAAKLAGISRMGGKYDDITVVVARVEPEMKLTSEIYELKDLDSRSIEETSSEANTETETETELTVEMEKQTGKSQILRQESENGKYHGLFSFRKLFSFSLLRFLFRR